MAIKFNPGSNALGSVEHRPSGSIKLARHKPDDVRVARLEARVEALEALFTALAKSVLELTSETKNETETVSVSPETVGDTPWVAAGVSRATWFRRQRAPKP